MTQSYESSIWSIDQALKFYKYVLQDLAPDEADFFCIAARKKYLDESQRLATRMGDTCMMNKTILKEHDEKKFVSKLHQTDAGMDWYTALNGNPLPRSCIVFYININHTSVHKAVKDFKHELAEFDYEFACASMKNNADNASRKLAGIHNRMLKAFQDPKNQTSNWLDVDMDIDKSRVSVQDIVDAIQNMENINGKPALEVVPVIETQGGYHVLLSQFLMRVANKCVASIYKGSDIRNHVITTDRVLNTLRSRFGDCGCKEITMNQNKMVPLPGTLQNGFEVKLHMEGLCDTTTF